VKKYSYFGFTFLVIILDQASKIIVRSTINLHETIRVTEKFFWLTNIQNSGAAFSLFSNDNTLTKYLLILVSIIAMVILTILILKSKSKIEQVVFALILGGAAGNLIDRIIFGKVTDFLWCDFPDLIMERWPVFNLADSSIVIAITIMIIHTVFFTNKAVEE